MHNIFQQLKDDHSVLKLQNNCVEKEKAQISELLKDEYVAKKCNRERRILEHIRHIETYGEELLNIVPQKKLVIDIGPGPGEFLEICRFLGYDIKGYDTCLSECEMGDEYVLFSSLLAKQQQLDIEYVGFENLISSLPFEDSSTYFINSRGSIEQVFKDHLIGVPHRVHKNSAYLCWNISEELKNKFIVFLKEIERILEPGGVFLIFGNGAMNTKEYDKLLKETISQTPSLYLDEKYMFENRLHKIIKGTTP